MYICWFFNKKITACRCRQFQSEPNVFIKWLQDLVHKTVFERVLNARVDFRNIPTYNNLPASFTARDSASVDLEDSGLASEP